MGRKWNLTLDVITGALFGVGWWLFVDGVSNADVNGYGTGRFELYVGPILCTLGLFILNNLRGSFFHSDSGEEMSFCEKTLLVFSIMCHVAGVVESIWVYLANKSHRANSYTKWRGTSSIICSILLTVSSIGWRWLSSSSYDSL